MTYAVMGAAIGVIYAVVVMPTMFRNRSKGLLAQGRLECGMRVLGGEVAGLRRVWRHGVAELGADGHLRFRTYRGGLRPFPRPPVDFRVTAVVDPTLRPPGFPAVMSVAWYCRTVVLATDTGLLQVALLPEIAPWVLNHLVPPGDASADPWSGVATPGAVPPSAPTPEGFVPPT